MGKKIVAYYSCDSCGTEWRDNQLNANNEIIPYNVFTILNNGKYLCNECKESLIEDLNCWLSVVGLRVLYQIVENDDDFDRLFIEKPEIEATNLNGGFINKFGSIYDE